MKSLWHLSVVSKDQFEKLLDHERTVAGSLGFEEWSNLRHELITFLSGYGREDSGVGRAGKGDFFVDSDWYGSRKLSVCFPSQKLFSQNVLVALQRFLQRKSHPCVVTIVGDYPSQPILFTFLITASTAVMAFGGKGRAEYEKLQVIDPDVQHWLNLLDGLAM